MKRALAFILVFVGVIAGIYLLIFGTNYSAIQTLRENQEGMAEGVEFVENTKSLKGLTMFIAEHPEYVSITSYNIDNPDSGIYYQSDIPRTMGATANLFLLIEYERQVSNGEIDPNELVSSTDVERFSLPQISKNTHQQLLNSYDDGELPLKKVVSAMIENSDLVAADFLWFKLGEHNVRSLVKSLNFSEESLPLPFSGMYITINPALNDTSKIKNLSFSEFAEVSISNAAQLKNDNLFNNKVKEQFDDDRLSLTFMQERDALALFPQSSTRALADLIANLLRNEVISPKISQKVKEKLQWAMEADHMDSSFENYGAVYENRMGLLGGIDFGTSIYDKHTSVQAVFFDRLPIAFWLHMSSNHIHKDFQQRLIWDPALYETTLNEIELTRE